MIEVTRKLLTNQFEAALCTLNECVDRLRDVGFDDGQIAEIVAATVQTILTNYFNLTARTPIDFPKALPLEIPA